MNSVTDENQIEDQAADEAAGPIDPATDSPHAADVGDTAEPAEVAAAESDDVPSVDEPSTAEEPADGIPAPEATIEDQPTSGELDGGPAEAAVAEAAGVQPEDLDVDPSADAPAAGSTVEGDAAEVAADDELDDLLGMAGAEAEDVVAADDNAEQAVADAAADIAEDPVTEADEPKKPRRPRRPQSIEDVRDQKELRRMAGRWYVVHTYAGYEQRVKDNITNRVDTYDAGDRILEIVIPTEEVTEYKKGKKVVSDKKFLPGYVLVRMDMDDETWGIVRHTPAVTGFVGANGVKPVPLSLREVASTLKIPKEFVEETDEAAEDTSGSGDTHVVPEKQQIDIDLEVGETVRVTTGPFADFTGTIDEINLDQAKLRVLVSVFGRETPIEIPFDNVAAI